MNNFDVMKAIWKCEDYSRDLHKFTANIVDNLMKEVFYSRSTDNISIIVITFENFL